MGVSFFLLLFLLFLLFFFFFGSFYLPSCVFIRSLFAQSDWFVWAFAFGALSSSAEEKTTAAGCDLLSEVDIYPHGPCDSFKGLTCQRIDLTGLRLNIELAHPQTHTQIEKGEIERHVQRLPRRKTVTINSIFSRNFYAIVVDHTGKMKRKIEKEWQLNETRGERQW